MSAPSVSNPASGKSLHPLGMALVWLLVIAGLYWLMEGYLKPPSARISSEGSWVLPRHRDGHFYADGSVNGIPVRFLVDTGASVVSVSDAIARQAGLEGGRSVTFQTANGPREGRMARAREVRVGPNGVEHLMVGTGYTAGHEHQGLLGQNFLSHFEIRMNADRLEMRMPSADPG